MNVTRKALFICCAAGLFFTAGCGKDQVKTGGTPSASLSTAAAATNGFSERYENEGFISKDLYRVIIIQPNDIAGNDAEAERQVKAKAIASLKKYISSTGKSLKANTNAEILNLIGNSGVIKKISAGTNTLFVLDIAKPDCRQFVDTLGQ